MNDGSVSIKKLVKTYVDDRGRPTFTAVKNIGNLIARIPGEHLYHLGEALTVQLNLEKAHLFDAETENIIR